MWVAGMDMRPGRITLISRSAIRHITFSPDGELIAFGGDDMCIYIVSHTIVHLPVGRIKKGCVRDTTPIPANLPRIVELNVQISVHSGQVVDKIPIQTTLWSLSWHPTNNWLGYAVAPKGTAVVWYMVRQE